MKSLDAVLEHAARRDPMYDVPLMVRFNSDVVAQAAAELASLRSLLVEARDALRREEATRVHDCDRAGTATGHGYVADHKCHGSTAALLARIDAEVGK